MRKTIVIQYQNIRAHYAPYKFYRYNFLLNSIKSISDVENQVKSSDGAPQENTGGGHHKGTVPVIVGQGGKSGSRVISCSLSEETNCRTGKTVQAAAGGSQFVR